MTKFELTTNPVESSGIEMMVQKPKISVKMRTMVFKPTQRSSMYHGNGIQSASASSKAIHSTSDESRKCLIEDSLLLPESPELLINKMRMRKVSLNAKQYKRIRGRRERRLKRARASPLPPSDFHPNNNNNSRNSNKENDTDDDNINNDQFPKSGVRVSEFTCIKSSTKEEEEEEEILRKQKQQQHQQQYQRDDRKHSDDDDDDDDYDDQVFSSLRKVRSLSTMLICLSTLLLILFNSNTAEGVDCFKCSSRNGSNPACEDPFHNLNTTRITSPVLPDPAPNVIYHTPCYAGKKGREGLFPASACIKLTGTFARMSHCGKFNFDGDSLKGCVLACPEDACNSAPSTLINLANYYYYLIAVLSATSIFLLTQADTIQSTHHVELL